MLTSSTGGSYNTLIINRITSFPQGTVIAPKISLSNPRRSINYRNNIEDKIKKSKKYFERFIFKFYFSNILLSVGVFNEHCAYHQDNEDKFAHPGSAEEENCADDII